MLYGAIEAGGTKFICAIGTAGGEILESARFPTRDPNSTLAEVLDYFVAAERKVGAVSTFGLSAFGPVDLRPNSPSYGHITTTPKPGWRNADVLGMLRHGLRRPIGFDTDVNAAALAEARWGAGRGLKSLVYVTVGTGIGAGILHHNMPVHGLMHAEAGHTTVRRHPADTAFSGICPFHHDCLEGLACGPAIVARRGRSLDQLEASDPAWDIEADYLGQLCAQLSLMHSPERILMGGGVMQQARLFPLIRARMHHWLNGYLSCSEIQEERYVAPPGLADLAGIKGALALALEISGGY